MGKQVKSLDDQPPPESRTVSHLGGPGPSRVKGLVPPRRYHWKGWEQNLPHGGTCRVLDFFYGCCSFGSSARIHGSSKAFPGKLQKEPNSLGVQTLSSSQTSSEPLRPLGRAWHELAAGGGSILQLVGAHGQVGAGVGWDCSSPPGQASLKQSCLHCLNEHRVIKKT